MNTLKDNASPADIGAFMRSLKEACGRKSGVYSSVYPNGTCGFSLYPNGIGKDGAINTGQASGWGEASREIVSMWGAQRANHRSVNLRKMALEIIQITADQGVCTDQALRLTFDQSEIDELGAEAAETANEMASNGPFSITKTTSANAA